jgi:tetratricopeptide (TPR) repeat protein
VTEVVQGLAEASLLLDVHRYDEAASLLARTVAAEPDNGQAWCLLAAAHLGAGRHAETVAAARRASTLTPDEDWPHRLASIAQRHLGRAGAALGAANEACRLAPGEWRAYICLAQAQLAEGIDFVAAQRSAAFALRLAPDEPDAHFTAGQVCYAQERWAAAREYQARALALDPTHSGALNELGRISLRLGGDPLAAQHFIEAARSAPGDRTFGRNVEVPVQYVLSRVVGAVYAATFVLVYVTLVDTEVPRSAATVGYALAIALTAVYGAARFRQMPPEMRALTHNRRVGLAMSAIFGAALIELITAVAATGRSVFFALPPASAVVVLSALAASAILRRKSPAPA